MRNENAKMRNRGAWITAEKKWWAVLLGGVLNAVIYTALLNLYCFISEAAAACLFTVPFILTIVVLSTASMKKLFISTGVYTGAWALIGVPLAKLFHMRYLENLHPGELPWPDEGSGAISATFFYLIMGFIAWGVAAILTAHRAEKTKTSA